MGTRPTSTYGTRTRSSSLGRSTRCRVASAGGRSIDADELLFVPRRAFQYYVLALAQFFTSEAGRGERRALEAIARPLTAVETG